MPELIISISGIRGIAGESLSEAVAYNFGKAFGVWLKRTETHCNASVREIVVGRDTRNFGVELLSALAHDLASEGYSVLDIGVASTPTVQVYTIEQKAVGGVIITASHNPKQWNGLKFVSSRGMFLTESEANEFIEIYHQIRLNGETGYGETENAASLNHLSLGFGHLNPPKGGLDINHQAALNFHLQKVLSNVDVELIRSKRFKVALDSTNGAGCEITPMLLDALGCEVVGLHLTPQADFERLPEPIPGNLTKLSEAVISSKADIGFAQDPDADRLAIVDEKGRPIGEDNTLVIAVDHVLGKQSAALASAIVVTNLSTTMAIDDIAYKYKAVLKRTKIGEVNVSEVMQRDKAIIGGEGNGGVIWPVVGLGRDSISGIALVLEYLATKDEALSKLVAVLPRYFTVKDKLSCSTKAEVKELLARFAKIQWPFEVKEIDQQDGQKVVFADCWVHLRGSNTEPIVRIFAESKTLKQAQELVELSKSFIYCTS